MGGKLTSGGIKLPETGDVEQSKVVISVDGREADETGNIDLGGAFDYVDKKTQIRGCKALTWNTLRIQGIDDWERQRNTEFSVDEESLTVSTLTGEYVYIAEVDEENKSSAYYRSDNGGATYSRHIVPTEGVDVKLIRTSETGQVVLLSTHIGGVLISEDYGKTWIIPHSLDGSTSNSDSSWFISMSSNGQNLIYPNTDGDLYLENPSSVDFGLHTLVLPSGVTPNSIKEFFVSNHTDRANIKMAMMTRNGNVYTSVNGGVQWSHAISSVNGMYTDKDVDKIYVIKGTTVQYRSINGTGFTTKVDFKTYSKYQDLTRDPNVFQLRSIFVSHDHDKDKSNIAVFTVSGTGSSYGTSNQAVVEDDVGYDVVEGEDVLAKPYAEKGFTGILISEDSGDTWDLSQIKYTWGLGTPMFHWPGGLDQTIGYPRLQLIENFESGLFIYSQTVGITKSHNNIIRICDKSTSYSSTSKMILDGGITLGQSMEADTEYFNKMPGTIEYENFSDGYVFHFKESSWTFYEYRNSPQFGANDDIFHKPLTLTGSSGWYGKPVKSIEFSHTLKGMNRIESRNIALTNTRIATGELLMKGGISDFDFQSLLDDGYTIEEAAEYISEGGFSGSDIISSGIKVSDLSGIVERIEALEHLHVHATISVATSSQATSFAGSNAIQGSEDGYYIGDGYAILYYAGAYKITLSAPGPNPVIPVKITMLAGAGGGAGGYQGNYGGAYHQASVGLENGFNAPDGGYTRVQHNTYHHLGTQVGYSGTNPGNSNRPNFQYSKPMGTLIEQSFIQGWQRAFEQGDTSNWTTPPYNQNWHIYRNRQLPWIINKTMLANQDYLLYVGSGGRGGKGGGGGNDWDWYGGAGGAGGAGGTRGAGSNGGGGGRNGHHGYGGSGGIAGGVSGAKYENDGSESDEINIELTPNSNSLSRFGQVGANGAGGANAAIHRRGAKDTGGGGGGGGGSNGIIIIEWGI